MKKSKPQLKKTTLKAVNKIKNSIFVYALPPSGRQPSASLAQSQQAATSGHEELAITFFALKQFQQRTNLITK